MHAIKVYNEESTPKESFIYAYVLKKYRSWTMFCTCKSTRILPLNPSAMDWKMQPSEVYAQVEEETRSQEVEVEELVDDALECVQVGSSTCHYFVDVDEEDNHTRGTPHKDIWENPNFEEAHHRIMNLWRKPTLPSSSHCH